MEEKKSYKISLLSTILLIINIILIISVIILCINIKNLKDDKSRLEIKVNSFNNIDLSSNSKNENIENEEKERAENKITNTTIIDKSENKISNENNIDNKYTAKNVENKPYIYDAGYSSSNVKATKYTANDGVEYSILDIKVPYINMNSDTAEEMNNEIEELYNGYVEEFKVCSQNENSYIKVNYETYVTSNIYSVLIKIERNKEGKSTNSYVAYNFDVITGTKLDYNQVCSIAGISNVSKTVLDYVNTLKDYDSYTLKTGFNVSQEQVDERNAEIDKCKSQVYKTYQDDLLNNNLIYFLDNNLKLNIVLDITLPDGSDSYTAIATL